MKEHDQNIVLIGGGTGLSYILKGLKKYPVNITTIVTVADDGGSSGMIRESNNAVPPGDIRKVMVAMSETEPLINRLLNYRFKDESLFKQHTIGNIMLTALYELNDGDYIRAIKQLGKVLNIKGDVLPVATTPVTLVAEMMDGSVVEGESEITKAKKKIKNISLKQSNVETNQEVLDAIEHADLIVLGPGSLYTSIIPNLLINQVSQAIRDSKAERLYVCNVMTEPGETDGYTVSDHVKAIERYLGEGVIDIIMANDDYNVPEPILNEYIRHGASLVTVDLDQIATLNRELITSRFLHINKQKYIRHKSNKIAAYIVMKLIDELDD